MTTIHLNNRTSLTQLAAEARRLADVLDRLAIHGAPAPADMAGAPVLRRWRIGLTDRPALTGTLVGDPEDGDRVHARIDDLVAMDYPAGWARTLTRWYATDARRRAP